jgi:hypothetical protein
MSLLLASIAQGSVELKGGLSVAFGFTPPVTARVRFDSDGSIAFLTSGQANWYNPTPTAGIGASYELYAERIAGSLPTSGTVDTWLSLSSDKLFTLESNSGEDTCTLKISIRIGSTVVAVGDYILSAEVIV